jgi:hypothetical protein
MAQLASVSTSLNILQASLWIFAIIVVGAMAVSSYFGEEEYVDTKTGKKKKRRKVPKQLRPYVFRKGAANPQSQRVPKGTGRSKWKTSGVVFRDEMGDEK